MNRRGLLALAAGAVSGLLARRSSSAATELRPPGALPPGAFERACIGCLRCAEVCPTRAIRFPTGVGLGAAHPFLALRDSACVLCMACTEAWPDWKVVFELARAMGLGRWFPWKTWAEAEAAPRVPVPAASGLVPGFDPPIGQNPLMGTPSGRIELASSLLERAGHPPLPEEANANLLVDADLLDSISGFPAFRSGVCRVEAIAAGHG